MTQNPFETPEAEPQFAGSPRAFATGRIDIGECLQEAWKTCWENFPLWLGVGIVAYLVLMVAEMTIIGIFIIWPVIYFGWTRFLLNMLEPNKAEFNDLFSGFSNFAAALVPILLLGMLCCVPFVPFMIGAVAENEVVIGIGGVIFAGVFLVAGPRLLPWTLFYIVDRGMGLSDAMRASWEATRGQWLTIVGLGLLAMVIQMAGYI